MFPHIAIVASLALALIGCAIKTPVALVPTGGSRADGTVTLSYEIGSMQKPIVNMEQAAAAAGERCTAWGYHSAQPFGGETRQCQQPSEYGCLRWFVSMTYQCLGRG
jgi:hypothetical protein